MDNPCIPEKSSIVEYYKGLLQRWTAHPPPMQDSFINYLRQLAHLAQNVGAAVSVDDNDLNMFRRLVMDRPDDLRRRLLGANLQRLRGLDRNQRAALRALEVAPDLLSPLGDLRYEPAHSRLLGYFMDRRRVPGLADRLLLEVLAMIDAPAEATDDDSIAGAVVSTEVAISDGRVDLQIDTPRLLAFIEVKIDAAEGPSQLSRYRQALDKRAEKRAKVLAFLTLPDGESPPARLSCSHVTFDDLLSRWLPLVRSDDYASTYLAHYLCSVARLLSISGEGPFENWTFADQRLALDFVSRLSFGGFHADNL